MQSSKFQSCLLLLLLCCYGWYKCKFGWLLGFRTVRIIDPWVSIHVHWVSIRRSLSINPHAVSHVYCAECRCWINSLLHWNHMVFRPELVKCRYLPFHRSLSIKTSFVEYRLHMLSRSHMYVVQSADARANLSSIEIIWCLSKNCTSIGTCHIIDPWVSISHSLSSYDRSTYCSTCMLCWVPMLD
jgi:hypothetical protein